MKLKDACFLEEKLWQSVLKSRDITLPTDVHIVKAMVFPVVMYGCESWTTKKAECWSTELTLQTVVLEKTLVSLLGSKEFKPVNPKGNQHWIFIGRTDADAEASMLWPSDSRNWLIGKDPDAGKDWGQEEKGVTEDEMVGWHHSVDMNLSKLREILKDSEAWHAAVHGVTKSQIQPSNWTETTINIVGRR